MKIIGAGKEVGEVGGRGGGGGRGDYKIILKKGCAITC